ncbi:MAG: TRAP transporter substrate-binding protein [Alphaproteobacteria bacterium]|nr:TRAP transporter substrate-binding protein [Alphaproteobacteria bacterium]
MPDLSRIVSAVLLAATSLCMAGVATGQDKKPIEFRYTTGAPAKTPWVMQLERFEKDVDEESKGALKIQSFISAQLGNEQDTVQQVARGRIDMGGFSSGAVALIAPEIALLGLPFYFSSVAQQDCVIDGMSKEVATLLARKGIRFLGWTEVGTVDVVGKKPYLTPADVKGLKAASASHKVSSGMWSALGANPSPIGITEIASAFQTGLVDVNATVVTFYLPSGLAKAAPVMTRVEMSDAPGIILMNKGVYDRLSADHKSMLDRAVARRSATQLRAEIRGFEETLRGMHVKAGGTIVQTTTDQREQWRKVLEPVWPRMVKDIGGDAEKFFQLMEAGRKTCGDKKS